MKNIAIATTLLLAGFAGQAHAEGFYMIGGLGIAQIDSDIGNLSASSGSLTLTTKVDSTGQAWQLGGGYQVNDVLSVEGGYLSISGLSADATLTANNAVVNGNTINGSLKASQAVTGHAWYVAPRLSYRTGDWDLFVKGGLALAQVKSRFSISGAGTVNGNAISGSYTYSASDDTTVPMLGLGAQYDFNKEFGVRGEFVWLDTIGDKKTTGASPVKLWMVSGLYKF